MPMDRPTTNSFDKMASSSLVRSRVIAVLYLWLQNVRGSVFPRKCACCHSRCRWETLRLDDADLDDEFRISVRLTMCIAERERAASGCRASGLSPGLPVHVVLVRPLLVPPPSPVVVVTKKLWILPVPATSLCHRRFFARFVLLHWKHRGLQSRTFIRRTHHNDVEQDTL